MRTRENMRVTKYPTMCHHECSQCRIQQRLIRFDLCDGYGGDGDGCGDSGSPTQIRLSGRMVLVGGGWYILRVHTARHKDGIMCNGHNITGYDTLENRCGALTTRVYNGLCRA